MNLMKKLVKKLLNCGTHELTVIETLEQDLQNYQDHVIYLKDKLKDYKDQIEEYEFKVKFTEESKSKVSSKVIIETLEQDLQKYRKYIIYLKDELKYYSDQLEEYVFKVKFTEDLKNSYALHK